MTSTHFRNGPHSGRRLEEEVHTVVDLRHARSMARGGSIVSGAWRCREEQHVGEMGNRAGKKYLALVVDCCKG
jgi:hypothetical protein